MMLLLFVACIKAGSFILSHLDPPPANLVAHLETSKIDSKAPADYFLSKKNEAIQKGTVPPPRLLCLFNRDSAFVGARSFVRVGIRDRAAASPQWPCAQDH
jgi:hypothetical protein